MSAFDASRSAIRVSAEPYRRITVVGGGAWGTALAVIAARAGRETRLWARRQDVVDDIWRVIDVAESLNLALRLDEVETRIAASVAADPRRPYTDSDIGEARAAMRAFIADRRAYMDSEIPGPL